jgi:SAM-dependent methyltransferase
MQREGFRVTAAHEERHWWFRARRELFLRQVERAARDVAAHGRRPRILDYGCGTGYNLRFLARYGEVCAADVAGESASEWRRLSGTEWIDLDADLAPHRGRFDVVTALDVLEHIEDDVAGLRAIGALLRPGGQIVLTVPAYRWLWGGEDVISEHRRRYTRASLARVCEAAGLVLRFLSYWNLSTLPAMAAAIWSERIFSPGAPPRSNLRSAPAWLNEWLYRLTSREARWVGEERLRLPAGASLVARCAAAA